MKKIILYLLIVLSMLGVLVAVTSCSDIDKPDSEITDNPGGENPSEGGGNTDDPATKYVIQFDFGDSIKTLISSTGKFTVPEIPEKDGYLFDGWYIGDEKVDLKEYTVTGDVKFTAGWIRDPEILYTWDSSSITIQMTNKYNSNSDMYTKYSGSAKRYLAGEDESCTDYIDDLIIERNKNAERVCNTDVIYKYYDDVAQYGMGRVSKEIIAEITAYSTDRPDIYCTYLYDMLYLSLQGYLKNLYNDGSAVNPEKANHLSFMKEDFTEEDSGYMYDFMKSLSLTNNGVFILASDYFLDTVRSFQVIPINVSLMNSIGVDSENEGAFNRDRTGDGKFTIDDFYRLVYDGEWSYETLSLFAGKIYNDNKGNAREGEETLGFAVSGRSSIVKRALAYSSPAYTAKRTWNGELQDYDYGYPYPEKYAELPIYKTLEAIDALFKSDGAVVISDYQTDVNGMFREGRVLFGNIERLGIFEEDVYRNAMFNKEMDIGFVMVPSASITDEKTGKPYGYNTQIYDTAIVGGISVATNKYARCTAFIDYQSTHSGDIIDEYFDCFTATTDSTNTSLKDMLLFIRKNVGAQTEKTLDYVGADEYRLPYQKRNQTLHEYIKNHEYESFIDFEDFYSESYHYYENYIRSFQDKMRSYVESQKRYFETED